ncbi:MAG TPA: hypothetical protein EYP58_05850 [bacterium (Candidatus Stahlbacteria)]|nr:hypothetical protein [Candidatus Stahlbacteria bacterium]
MKYLICRIGKTNLAFQIENVEGVLEEVKIVPVPKAPEYVEGITNVRNQIVSVISLAKLLKKDLKTGQKWILIVEDNNRFICEIDEVGDLINVEETTPVKGKPGIIVSTIERGGEIYSVIDPRKITRG